MRDNALRWPYGLLWNQYSQPRFRDVDLGVAHAFCRRSRIGNFPPNLVLHKNTDSASSPFTPVPSSSADDGDSVIHPHHQCILSLPYPSSRVHITSEHYVLGCYCVCCPRQHRPRISPNYPLDKIRSLLYSAWNVYTMDSSDIPQFLGPSYGAWQISRTHTMHQKVISITISWPCTWNTVPPDPKKLNIQAQLFGSNLII